MIVGSSETHDFMVLKTLDQSGSKITNPEAYIYLYHKFSHNPALVISIIQEEVFKHLQCVNKLYNFDG